MPRTLADATRAELAALSIAMTHDSRIADGRTCDPNPRRTGICRVCNPEGTAR